MKTYYKIPGYRVQAFNKRDKKIPEQKMYFSSPAQETLDAWTGGKNYKHLFAVELFGYKLEFWKKT